MNHFIVNLINENKKACNQITALEDTINNYEYDNSEDYKATIISLSILLKGYCMVAEATECLLLNENVVKNDYGEFYSKTGNIKISDNVFNTDTNNIPIKEPNEQNNPNND